MSSFFLLLQGGGLSLFWTIAPFVLIFGIFYFLVILPQKRQQQELKDMIASLGNGDEIVTNGGVIGKIIEVRENSFVIRSAEKAIIEIGKSAVVGKRADEEKK